MILISHRGNTAGPTPRENQPDYIMETAKSFDVEVDAWYMGGWFLGHDFPQYPVNANFLKDPRLWVHCKNYDALQLGWDLGLHCFYHTDEDYVLTSSGYIWAYPGMPGAAMTICVMPEKTKQNVSGFAGVCSDWVGNYV